MNAHGNAAPAQTPGTPKKKRKWPWIVGALLAVGLVGSCLDTTDTTSDDAAPKPEETTAPATEATTKETSEESATTEAPQESPQSEETGNVGEAYEKWYLAQYDPPTWEHVCDAYGGWACHVRVVRSIDSDDTIVFVTNLSKANPEGLKLAENAVTAVKNQAALDDSIPQSLKEKVKYVQVWDLRGDVLANDWVEFTA